MSKTQFTFGATPTVSMRRSRFKLDHANKTSMSLGKLYPIDVTEVLPGDTFKLHTSQVCRLTSAFLRPVMDNCYMDVYYFFVPNRLVLDNWENVMGQNDQSAWAENDMPEVPTLPAQNIESKTVADYFGLPLGAVPSGINVLPFRGFALIYNQWFRNENTVQPMHIQKGEVTTSENFNNNAWSPNNYTGQLPYVGKKKDYFTSCLPSPQKGEAVTLPLGNNAPVITGETIEGRNLTQLPSLEVISNNGRGSGVNTILAMKNKSVGTPYALGDVIGIDNNSITGQESSIIPTNLYADLSLATASNVNDLRMAFALQKMLEKDARYGTRYNEYILGHFGVSNPDARLQIPEFLGGSRMPINVQQVAQTNTQQKTSEQTLESPLASLGAMSQSVGKSRFTKSFTEHGFVFTVACIRQLHTYQQGINKMWSRKKREDYYDPLFANIGEQPVYTSEIFAKTESDIHGNVFGYNEAWADYRYKPSIVSGEMRSGVTNTLDVWNFADYYENAPVLGEEFTNETAKFFDRTVAVPSTSQDNFIVDFWFEINAYRVMPVYSIPGLIDHH